MQGPAFAADPIGPAFDPQAMLDAERGLPVDGLEQRILHGRRVADDRVSGGSAA